MKTLLILAASSMALLSGCSLTPLNSSSSVSLEEVFSPSKASLSIPGAVEKPATTVTQVERRESLTATGYAVISIQNHRLPAQQRLLAIRAAKLDAYRSLTEQVYGLKVDATATVADMVVQNDTFRSRVEGVIHGATLVSITPTGDDTYETTLSLDRAVVQDLRALYLGQLVAKIR